MCIRDSQKVAPRLTKKRPGLRQQVTPEERLIVTLRYVIKDIYYIIDNLYKICTKKQNKHFFTEDLNRENRRFNLVVVFEAVGSPKSCFLDVEAPKNY